MQGPASHLKFSSSLASLQVLKHVLLPSPSVVSRGYRVREQRGNEVPRLGDHYKSCHFSDFLPDVFLRHVKPCEILLL